MHCQPIAPCFQPLFGKGIRTPLKDLPNIICSTCNVYLPKGERTAAHFFRSKKHGGKSNPRNITIQCYNCQKKQGSSDARTFFFFNPESVWCFWNYVDVLKKEYPENAVIMEAQMKRLGFDRKG